MCQIIKWNLSHNNKPLFIENALQLGKLTLADGADNITRFKFSSIDLFFK